MTSLRGGKRLKKDGSLIGDIFIYGFLALFAIISIYPFFYVLFMAVMPYENFIATPVHLLPSGFTLEYFKQVLQDPNLPRAFVMSIVRTLVGTVFATVATMLAGYGLSRKGLKLGGFLSIFFLIPMYFGVGVIPYYITLNAYGITNTFWVLVLPGMISAMWLFVTKASFATYPQEILEASVIDGAGQWRVFWQVVWPTSLPTVATLASMYGIGHWNEYFMTRILVKSDLWTAPVYLYGLINSKITLQGLGIGVRLEPQSYISAVSSLLIIPILVLYPLMQRYVISGLTAGAVKG